MSEKEFDDNLKALSQYHSYNNIRILFELPILTKETEKIYGKQKEKEEELP